MLKSGCTFVTVGSNSKRPDKMKCYLSPDFVINLKFHRLGSVLIQVKQIPIQEFAIPALPPSKMQSKLFTP
jgi:hypothetical protein